MTDNKIEEIVKNLINNTKKIQYGAISVEIKIHSGKCSTIIYSILENTRQITNCKDT